MSMDIITVTIPISSAHLHHPHPHLLRHPHLKRNLVTIIVFFPIPIPPSPYCCRNGSFDSSRFDCEIFVPLKCRVTVIHPNRNAQPYLHPHPLVRLVIDECSYIGTADGSLIGDPKSLNQDPEFQKALHYNRYGFFLRYVDVNAIPTSHQCHHHRHHRRRHYHITIIITTDAATITSLLLSPSLAPFSSHLPSPSPSPSAPSHYRRVSSSQRMKT